MKKFQSFGRSVSSDKQKKVLGGLTEPGGGDICLGCSSDQECAQVNKGKCVTSYCNKKEAKWCDMS